MKIIQWDFNFLVSLLSKIVTWCKKSCFLMPYLPFFSLLCDFLLYPHQYLWFARIYDVVEYWLKDVSPWLKPCGFESPLGRGCYSLLICASYRLFTPLQGFFETLIVRYIIISGCFFAVKHSTAFIKYLSLSVINSLSLKCILFYLFQCEIFHEYFHI